ncbi:cell division protein ZapE [Rhizobium sp. SG2393]|uniref:cell division protein ZapE n=1 Tax=Rhizobium sp. SG2393 TaxID=3276279 RepID=UPI00366B4271
MPNPQALVTQKLERLVAEGALSRDPVQFAIARRFDALIDALAQSRAEKKSNALGWLFARRKAEQAPTRGLYIHGGVGRGKTMLMDMFFEAVPIKRKRRAHFHEFMADVHERINRHRQKLKAGETNQADPMPPVAADLMAEARLVCFDEFTVTDIADAMILSRLFGELFKRGCVLVATSNVAPDDLYRDGLNRSLFTPFIDLLKQYTDVVAVESQTDYRMEKHAEVPVWSFPLGPDADRNMQLAFERETAGHVPAPASIPHRGRSIAVPLAAGGVARFSYRDLCEAPLGASDYLAILERYHTIFIDHVPHMGPERRNETKRFILLVDTLYDQRARLFASAVSSPFDLLTARHGTEGFEFDRTVSRLTEMQSRDYETEAAASRTLNSHDYSG